MSILPNATDLSVSYRKPNSAGVWHVQSRWHCEDWHASCKTRNRCHFRFFKYPMKMHRLGEDLEHDSQSSLKGPGSESPPSCCHLCQWLSAEYLSTYWVRTSVTYCNDQCQLIRAELCSQAAWCAAFGKKRRQFLPALSPCRWVP